MPEATFKNHSLLLQGHFMVARLANPSLAFPFVALVISGGHTQLILVRSLGRKTIHFHTGLMTNR
jgi:tRNA A37 threonylcarbamoyltransferase TsaD